MRRVWVTEIRFADEVIDKLASKHGVRPEEVEDVCLFSLSLQGRRHWDPKYGDRLIVRGRAKDGSELIIYLAPINENEGVWECRTARRLT